MDARRRHPQLRARSGRLVMRYGDLLQAVVVVVALAHGTPREQATKAGLEQLMASYDLRHYTWIYGVVVRDEAKIAGVVARHGLAVPVTSPPARPSPP